MNNIIEKYDTMITELQKTKEELSKILSEQSENQDILNEMAVSFNYSEMDQIKEELKKINEEMNGLLTSYNSKLRRILGIDLSNRNEIYKRQNN